MPALDTKATTIQRMRRMKRNPFFGGLVRAAVKGLARSGRLIGKAKTQLGKRIGWSRKVKICRRRNRRALVPNLSAPQLGCGRVGPPVPPRTRQPVANNVGVAQETFMPQNIPKVLTKRQRAINWTQKKVKLALNTSFSGAVWGGGFAFSSFIVEQITKPTEKGQTLTEEELERARVVIEMALAGGIRAAAERYNRTIDTVFGNATDQMNRLDVERLVEHVAAYTKTSMLEILEDKQPVVVELRPKPEVMEQKPEEGGQEELEEEGEEEEQVWQISALNQLYCFLTRILFQRKAEMRPVDYEDYEIKSRKVREEDYEVRSTNLIRSHHFLIFVYFLSDTGGIYL